MTNQMHDYAIFDHDRSQMGRFLGLGSIIISGLATQLLSLAYNSTGFEALTTATLTTGTAYFTLHFIFNKYCWKIPVFSIPNLSGKWLIEGKTLNEDGTVRFHWDGLIGIEQSWKSILIHLSTQTSQSYSYTATISKRHGPTGGWQLSYSYRNEPEIEATHELNPHKGYCEIQFDNELKSGSASYFNSAGRKTFGSLKLTREPENDRL